MTLSTAEVTAFLKMQLGGDVCAVAPIGKGDWSQAFSLTHDGAEQVVRFGAHVEDFAKDRYAARFSAPDLPVPRVLAIGEGLGGYFCLSERAHGEHLDRLEAAAMQRIAPAARRMLGALRDTDLGGSTGFGGWDSAGNAPHTTWAGYLLQVDTETERVHGWHARLEESPTGIAPYREALAYLEAHVDRCPDTRHLIHNDLLHYNVLVADDRISAVVDWGNALYGDFLYDLAAFTFYAPWFPAMEGIDWAQGAGAIPNFEVRLRCYHAHIGLDGMAYSAFTRRWESLAEVAARTLRLIRRPPPP